MPKLESKCLSCDNEFYDNSRNGRPKKFCSPACYHESLKMNVNERFISLKDRLYNHSKLNKKTGCIEWQKRINNKGYGFTGGFKTGSNILAHRASWMINKGSIENNLCVLHKCDNRKCINIDHLFLGTKKDNSLDCKLKGRSRGLYNKGSVPHNRKITEETAKEIIIKLSSNITIKKIAIMFNTTFDIVYDIKRNKTWKHIKVNG